MARMRLRSRARRATEDRALSAFDAWVTIGNLDALGRGHVDPAGRVAVAGAGWFLDWWVGAEDRWHLPAEEAAVRQHLVGSSPVVETRVRVPGGDAVSRAYGARGPAGEDLLVIEVANDSTVPVALALALRPHRAGTVTTLALAGSTLTVDGSPALHLARSPGRIALSSAADDRDAGEVVLAGDAEPVRSASVRCDEGDARAVLLLPLAHTARLRVAIAVDGASRAVDPAALPAPEQVASGWAAHTRGGARLEVPDRRLREAVAATGRALLLDGAGAEAAHALSALGFPDEATARAGDAAATVGAALAERGDRWRWHRRPLAGDEAAWLATLVEAWGALPAGAARTAGAAALPAVADLLAASGEPRAAADVRALAAAEPAAPPSAEDPTALLAAARPTWTWPASDGGPDPVAAARFLLAVRALVVAEVPGGIALSPSVPEAWLGQGWEVHDLPTGAGLLSFAIRWHGERPALLWELQPHPGEPAGKLTVPALDPDWSSTERSGEALLAPVPVPERPRVRRGLTIPVTIEPTRPRP